MYEWCDGSSYEGDVLNGKRSGKGIFRVCFKGESLNIFFLILFDIAIVVAAAVDIARFSVQEGRATKGTGKMGCDMDLEKCIMMKRRLLSILVIGSWARDKATG